LRELPLKRRRIVFLIPEMFLYPEFEKRLRALDARLWNRFLESTDLVPPWRGFSRRERFQ
jgi:hypothetical protein